MKAKNELIRKVLTKRIDNDNPQILEDYIAKNGYSALKKAVSMPQIKIIEEVKASGLKGRGGAGFPTGLKMEAVLKAQGAPKYIICNADEGEPGNFKDRYLMENDPHLLIEGLIICALAVGAEHGYIFIRGEYQKSIEIIRNALEKARKNGYLGDNILDAGFNFDLEIYTGAGSYVCGEEFALMVCIEGKPGRATYKPPFPTSEGLFNKPTQINNVETFANIPIIIQDGGEAFNKIGTEVSKGTKLVCLSGNINSPGLYEVPFGITLRDVIETLGDGVPNNRKIKMVQLGGASGPCIPESMLDIKLDYKEMTDNDLTFGSGAIIVMDDRIDILDILKRTLTFFRHESCGKCTPCREGIGHLFILLQRFIDKTASNDDLKLVEILLETINQTSICGLGQLAPTSMKSVLKYFREEFTSRIDKSYVKQAFAGGN
jgi:NADH:ubiquinone oxidoreductase subunit F (NADH-binding)